MSYLPKDIPQKTTNKTRSKSTTRKRTTDKKIVEKTPLIDTKNDIQSEWIGQEFVDIEKYAGFVYKIEQLDDNNNIVATYFGWKLFHATKNKPITKKELAERGIKPGRKPTKTKVVKESDWKDYYGSSTEIKDRVKSVGRSSFRRTILYLCDNKKIMTYLELREIVDHRCIEPDYNDKFLNSNILGSIYCRDIKGYVKIN